MLIIDTAHPYLTSFVSQTDSELVLKLEPGF